MDALIKAAISFAISFVILAGLYWKYVPHTKEQTKEKPRYTGRVIRNSKPKGTRVSGQKWRTYKTNFEVAGIYFRIDDVYFFTSYLQYFGESGREFGLDAEREPDNPHDHNAIKILCWMTFENGSVEARHIGYVPREIAADIAQNIPRDIPISAEITRVRETEQSVFIYATLLIPSKNDPIWQGRFPEHV